MGNSYRAYLPETLREAFVAASEDPNLMSLKEEMALLRTILGKYLDQKDLETLIDGEVIDDITKLVDKIGKTQQSISAHEAKMRENIPIKMIPLIIQAICTIIKQTVQDDQIVDLIRERIGSIPLLMAKPTEVEVVERRDQ
jgi:flagellar biosynthesis component FlhA